jgi:histone acetyltransferase (RNA polymerase elongator complex component)
METWTQIKKKKKKKFKNLNSKKKKKTKNKTKLVSLMCSKFVFKHEKCNSKPHCDGNPRTKIK